MVSRWAKAAGVQRESWAEPPPASEEPMPVAPQVQRVAKFYTPSQKAEILAHAAAAGAGPSPTIGPSPKDISAQRDAEILEEYKTHPGLGPSQIRNQLRRRKIRVSTHTARLVMESAGYRPPKPERQKHDRRYEAVRPNHLWHLDFVQRWIGRSSTFTLILIDDCSLAIPHTDRTDALHLSQRNSSPAPRSSAAPRPSLAISHIFLAPLPES